MKILFILDEFLPENSGGAANVAFWLAKGLMKAGHKLLVLTATLNSENVGEIEIGGIKIKRVLCRQLGKLRNFKNLNNRDILRKTKKILVEYRPDIVHIHALHHRFSYGSIGLAKKFSKAVFITLHDVQTIYNGKLYPKRKICNLEYARDYKINWLDCLSKDALTYNPFQRFFIKRALKKADKIFTVSNALKGALEVNGIGNIEVIYNGIDTGEWVAGGFSENKILFIGRVDEAKGAGILIKIFEDINSEIPDAKLLIVGDGGFKAGTNKNIEIIPWQYDRTAVKKLFAKAKVIVVPSLYLDPFPTINLEAMASAKPVVGTCFGGTPEIVINNETGYVVNPYNEKELTEKIISLLKNSEKTATFGKAGRERAEKFFNLEIQTKKTLAWYKKFIEE